MAGRMAIRKGQEAGPGIKIFENILKLLCSFVALN
jgi:hypothetical protein